MKIGGLDIGGAVQSIAGAVHHRSDQRAAAAADAMNFVAGQTGQQTAINLADAKSESWWQRGWRPAFGWCGGALFATCTGLAIAKAFGHAPAGDALQMLLGAQELWWVVLGILGLQVPARSVEKIMRGRANALLSPKDLIKMKKAGLSPPDDDAPQANWG